MSVIVEGRINGIDVCGSIQRITDAKAVKDAGFEYAYIQCSRYSSTRELSFSKTLDTLRNAGLRCGAYHFCSHDSDPRAQAEFFYKASGGLGSKPGELPPMVDWEHCTPQRYQNHPQHCVDWLASHLQAVEDLWYPDNADRLNPRLPVVYTYPVYSGSHQPALGQERRLRRALGRPGSPYPLAWASYFNVPRIPGELEQPVHQLPDPFTEWTIWQYSGDKGVPVPGIAGACDRQVFKGTSGSWAEFLGQRKPVDVIEGEVKNDAVPRV